MPSSAILDLISTKIPPFLVLIFRINLDEKRISCYYSY
nr:MAG TPA: hypothetical protein [Caudoviricetes sp.]